MIYFVFIKVHGEISVDEVIRRFQEMNTSKTNNSEEEFGTLGVAASVSEIKLDEKKPEASS